MKYIKIIALVIIFLCLAFLFYLQFLVISFNGAPVGRADAIVVLGHSLEDDSPAPWLVTRLERGMELFNNGYAPYIIVSGGRGPNDSLPVGYAMRDWLVAYGVPIEAIIIEANSANTFENMRFTSYIAQNHGIESIIVSTNYFHMYRAERTAAQFFDRVYAAPAHIEWSLSRLFYTLREPPALIKLFFDNLLYNP